MSLGVSDGIESQGVGDSITAASPLDGCEVTLDVLVAARPCTRPIEVSVTGPECAEVICLCLSRDEAAKLAQTLGIAIEVSKTDSETSPAEVPS